MSRISNFFRIGRPAAESTTTSAADPDGAEAEQEYETYSRWPLFPLYIGAYVAIWGGWVSLGRMSGFGPTEMLPGILPWTLDLSIVLPLGLEAYAAFSLGVWLTRKQIAPSARRFARWSSLAGLGLGIAGQVTYHSLVGLGYEAAPLWVVMVVAAVPVLTLAAASTLTHELGTGTKRAMAERGSGRPAAADEQSPDTAVVDDALTMFGDATATEPTASVEATGHKRPVSDEERRQIIAAAEAATEATGRYSERAIAREFGRSRDTVNRIIAEAKEAADEPTAAIVPTIDRPDAEAADTAPALAA
ncbi:helix-turn-helix domain-containing protein [Agromyces sp. SYSU K20354]|uniref:helix-turn-helix domain-containing protein n=1 Tax=Agromyces cavernae TaxID=2898659 RepID=UPI001E6443EB|nr:helix-turn-helix domain-containing protein [Agromyces cavernae]MCD2444337.1 helix-turn-helix domain-containing protein [Agromyces cavernae]